MLLILFVGNQKQTAVVVARHENWELIQTHMDSLISLTSHLNPD
jgi:hypothetical protein